MVLDCRLAADKKAGVVGSSGATEFQAEAESGIVFSGQGFDSDGGIIETIDFPYAEIDRRIAKVNGYELIDEAEVTNQINERAMAVVKSFLIWIWGTGPKNTEGIVCRAIVACWVCVPCVAAHNLTRIGAAFNKHKQSIGRACDDWKKRFPGVVNSHMKSPGYQQERSNLDN